MVQGDLPVNILSCLFGVGLSIEDLLHERGADFASPGRAHPHKEDQACHYACSKTKGEDGLYISDGGGKLPFQTLKVLP